MVETAALAAPAILAAQAAMVGTEALPIRQAGKRPAPSLVAMVEMAVLAALAGLAVTAVRAVKHPF